MTADVVTQLTWRLKRLAGGRRADLKGTAMTLNAPDWLVNVSPRHASELLLWHGKTVLGALARGVSEAADRHVHALSAWECSESDRSQHCSFSQSGLLTVSGHESSLHHIPFTLAVTDCIVSLLAAFHATTHYPLLALAFACTQRLCDSPAASLLSGSTPHLCEYLLPPRWQTTRRPHMKRRARPRP